MKLSKEITQIIKEAPTRTLEEKIKKVFEVSPVKLPRTTDMVMKVSQTVLRNLYPGVFEMPLSHNLDITIDTITVTIPVNLKNMSVKS